MKKECLTIAQIGEAFNKQGFQTTSGNEWNGTEQGLDIFGENGKN